jgi:hypothetical protein
MNILTKEMYMKQLSTTIAFSLLVSSLSIFAMEREVRSETGEVVGTEYDINRPQEGEIQTSEGKVTLDTAGKKYWVILNMTGKGIGIASDTYQLQLNNNEAARLYRTNNLEIRADGNTFETRNHCIVLYKGEDNKGMTMDAWATWNNEKGFSVSPHGSKNTIYPAEIAPSGSQQPGFGPGFGPGGHRGRHGRGGSTPGTHGRHGHHGWQH